MELLTSLLRAVAVLFLTLQSSISVRGLPAQRDDASRSDGDELEDGEDGTPRYYNFEDEENNWISSDATEVCTTFAFRIQILCFVHTILLAPSYIKPCLNTCR